MKKIILTVCVSIMVLLTTVMFIGCSAPNGYIKYGESPIYFEGQFPDDSINFEYHLHYQFKEENGNSWRIRQIYFSYKEERYYLYPTDRTGWKNEDEIFCTPLQSMTGGKFLVFNSSDTEIGAFYDQQKEDNHSVNFSYPKILFDEKYLYYEFKKRIFIGRFSISSEGRGNSYYKYEYYRFNLEIGENESVSLATFFEKLHAIDNRATLRKGKK